MCVIEAFVMGEVGVGGMQQVVYCSEIQNYRGHGEQVETLCVLSRLFR